MGALTIRRVRRYPVLIATLMVLLLAAVPRLRALTDDEKKALFLQSQGAGANDSASPSPSPSPSPTLHHKRRASAEATPRHRHTPAADDEETPEPDGTPHHRHHADDDNTPEPDVTPRHHHHGEGDEESPTPAHKHRFPASTPEETPVPEHHDQTPAPREAAPQEQTPVRVPAAQPVQQDQSYNAAPIPAAHAAPTPPPGQWGAQIDVRKEGLEEQGGFEPPPLPPPVHHHWWQIFGGEPEPQYHFLTREIRDAIDRAPVARHRWRFIVVHNSGTRQGNARIFDYYHRYVRKMPNGLAYHFVIGNGTSSGNGQIEIGGRWIKQLQGGHVHSDYLNNIALGICLVGDFNRDLPTKEQLEALDELIRYLRIRVGKIDGKPAIVKAHREINPPQWPTDCPGDRFPYRWLHERFD